MAHIKRSNIKRALGSAFGSDNATDDGVANVEAVLQSLSLRLGQCYHVSPVHITDEEMAIQLIFKVREGTMETKRRVRLKSDMTVALDESEQPITVGVGGPMGFGSSGNPNQARWETNDW